MGKAKEKVDSIRMQFKEAQEKRKAVYKKYSSEERVPVHLAPMYRAYFGRVMPVGINGFVIYFKVDGSTQKVPKSFADEINAKRKHIDAILNKQSRMSNFRENFENTAGELKMF